jgi:hypothetical protein
VQQQASSLARPALLARLREALRATGAPLLAAAAVLTALPAAAQDKVTLQRSTLR